MSDKKPLVMRYKDLVHKMFNMAKTDDLPVREQVEIPEKTVESYRKSFERIKNTLGETVPEIFSKTESEGWEAVHETLCILNSWKFMNGIEFTFAEGMVWGVDGFHLEINNGGLHQYFFNSSGDYWQHVLQVLIDSGNSEGEKYFRKAIQIFPDGFPSPNRIERWKQLEELETIDEDRMWSHFDACEEEYYEYYYPSDEDVYNAIAPRVNNFEPVWI